MRIFDFHVHLTGGETPKGVAEWLDAVGVERVALFSRCPEETPTLDESVPTDVLRARAAPLEEQKRRMEHLGGIVRAIPDRVVGLGRVDPTVPGTVDLIREAREAFAVTGIKLIPNGWYPYEERFFPLYETAAQLDMPILFHTGILWSWGDTSRFCRPVYLECLMQFAGLRFAMAHVGWPWTDECIATAQKFHVVNRKVGRAEPQAVVDLTPGTPEIYRGNVLEKTVTLLGTKRIVWGTDSYACRGNPQRLVDSDTAIFQSLGLSNGEIQDIFAGNAERFHGLA